MYNYLYLRISPSVTILYPSKLSKFNETRMFHKSNETWFGEKSPLRSPTSRKLNLRIGFEFDNQPSVDSFSWFRYVSNDFNAFDILFDASSSRPFPPTPTTPVQPFHPKLASVVPPLGRPNFEGSPSRDRWYKEIEDENLKITRSWWRLDEVHIEHRFNELCVVKLYSKEEGHRAQRMGRSNDLSSWHRISEGSCHGQTSIHRCELVAHGHIASWQPQHGKTAMKESSLPLHYIHLYTPLLHSPQVANLQMSVIHYFIP